MKNIEFKKIVAKNFMCFGDKEVSIEFEKFNNIVLIKGTNLDTAKSVEDAKSSSNGSGKSSIPEILVYGLFGQTIKSPKKISTKDVINQSTGKGLSVEIYWDDYKVERKRKPDSLRLWKGSDELTLGGMPATQNLIEEIIGLNYETFVNVVVFTDDNTSSFLECNAAEKRSIVENLLSLEKYKTYHENAKFLHKQHISEMKLIAVEITGVENSLQSESRTKQSLESNIKIWKQNKVKEINNLGIEIENCNKELKELETSEDFVEYEKAQDQIRKLTNLIEQAQPKVSSLSDVIDSINKQIEELNKVKNDKNTEKHNFNLERNTIISEIKKISEVLEKLNNLEPGVICNHCYGEIKPENYEQLKKEHQKIGSELKSKFDLTTKSFKSIESEIEILDSSLKTEKDSSAKKKLELTDIQDKITKARQAIEKLSRIKMPDNSTKISGLKEKVKILEKSLNEKKGELDKETPYDSMLLASDQKIIDLQNELNSKNEKYDACKKLENYFEFWKIAFGDNGIRKFVLDEIIPSLNDNLNYWLQFLIDGKLKIEFDNMLEEKITKFPNDGKPLVYHILSNGQRRRINLALAQAFAHIESLNTGKSPSLVFLDEVSSNIDPVGVECIYAMICELSKTKQVFVTTHDQNLLEMLNGCSQIHLQMKNGVSTLV